jgi:hypothetical protein
VTIFNDEAEKFLGCSPDEIIKGREDLSGFDFEHFMNKKLFEPYNFQLRSSVSKFFDDNRFEHKVVSVSSGEPRSISLGLIEEISRLENL